MLLIVYLEIIIIIIVILILILLLFWYKSLCCNSFAHFVVKLSRQFGQNDAHSFTQLPFRRFTVLKHKICLQFVINVFEKTSSHLVQSLSRAELKCASYNNCKKDSCVTNSNKEGGKRLESSLHLPRIASFRNVM